MTQSAWKSPSHETLLPCQTKNSAVHMEVPDKISTPTERVQPQTNQLQIKPAEFLQTSHALLRWEESCWLQRCQNAVLSYVQTPNKLQKQLHAVPSIVKKTLLRRPLSSAVFSYVQTPNKLSKRLHAADSIGEKGLGATCLTCCVFICTNPNQTAVLLGKTFRYSPRGKKKYSSISFNCARGQPDGPANRTEV